MTLALWCVLVAAILPYVTVGMAKAVGGRYDNHDPRRRAETYEGFARRAHAAHLNGFEAFPFFAAAVLLAELKGGPRGMVDALAAAFVLARVAYVACYVLDKPTLRSIIWALGLFSTFAIFLSPLWR